MELVHVGLTASTEEKANKFYADLLGLKKADPKILPAEISHAIFGIDRELTVINYIGASAHFEIFIYDAASASAGAIEHTCVYVDNLSEFLQNATRWT